MKKEDTIRLYAEQFLEGKGESARQQFYSKSMERQYTSIMAWRRRHGVGKKEAGVDINSLVESMRNVSDAIPLIEQLSERDRSRLREAAERIVGVIADFDNIKCRQEISRLEEKMAEDRRRLEELHARLQQEG